MGFHRFSAKCYFLILQADSCANVVAAKEISGEKLAKQQSTGSKYSLRVDKSVSGDLQKLRDRLAVAKAELSAIRADVVTVTSPERRSPLAQPRVPAAAPPKKKETKRVPPIKPPTYTLRNPAFIRQPVLERGSPRTGPVAAGRGAKQRTTKLEATLPRAAVGKPTVRPGAAARGPPVRPLQQKKPVVASQLSPRRVPQPPAAPKQLTTRRQADTGRPKVYRAAYQDTAPRKREVKQRQTAVASQRGGDPFPVDVDTQYTMKKFMAQRESDLSTSIATISDQPLQTLDHMVREMAKDVAQGLDAEKQLYQVNTDETCDQLQNAWLEFPVNSDELEHLKDDVNFDNRMHSMTPTSSPVCQDDKVGKPVDAEKVKDYVGSIVTSAHDMVAEHEPETDDENVGVSAAKQDELWTALTSDNENQTDVITTKTEKDAEELFSVAKKENKEMQITQSIKPLIEEVQDVERQADKTKFQEALIDEVGEVNYSTDDDAEGKKIDTGRKNRKESAKDEDRYSSTSFYDDHETLPDDDLNYNDEIRMLDQRLTSSTAVPMSRFSDVDVASLGSNESPRSIMSPDLQPRSLDEHLERIYAAGVQEAGTWKQAEERAISEDLVKVIDKESKAEIVVEYNQQNMDDKKTTEHPLDDELVNPKIADDNDEPEVYWSGADNEDEDELEYLKDSFEDTDGVDPTAAFTRDLTAVTTKIPYPLEDREWEPGVAASAEVDDGRQMIEPPGGHEVAKVTAAGGLVAGETVTKETVSAEVDDGRQIIEPSGGHEVAKVTAAGELVAGGTVTKETVSAEVDDDRQMLEPHDVGVASHDVAKVTVADGLVAEETVTKETIERVPSNAELTEIAAERENDYASDDDHIRAAIGETSNYLEEEYGIPMLSSLDREEDQEESMRGEGSPIKQVDGEPYSYALGDDGLPDFRAAYTENEDEATTMIEGGQEQLVSEQENIEIDGERPAIMDDEVSLLPEASQSEMWDDTLYPFSQPSSPVQPRESEEFAGDEEMENERDVDWQQTTTTVEEAMMDPGNVTEDFEYRAPPVFTDA